MNHQPDDPGVRPGTRARLSLRERLYLIALLVIVVAGVWSLAIEFSA